MNYVMLLHGILMVKMVMVPLGKIGMELFTFIDFHIFYFICFYSIVIYRICKAGTIFPELPKISVSHTYDIEYKYTYKCTLCNAK